MRRINHPQLFKISSALLLGFALSNTAVADEFSCSLNSSLQAKKSEKVRLEEKLRNAKAEESKFLGSDINDPIRTSAYNQRKYVEDQLLNIDTTINEFDLRCAEEQREFDKKSTKRNAAQEECVKNMNLHPGFFEWDESAFECKRLRNEAKSNPNDGECSDADLFSGSLKGEACKKANDKAASVGARNAALSQTAAMVTTGYAGMQAQQTTGFQDDAFKRQQNVMKAMAISKLVTGGMAFTGAMELKSAASDAETANSNISEAHKELLDTCAEMSELESQQCFYKNAESVGIDADEKSYATFSRMKNAAEQSQEAADKANEMAKVSMISGFADAVVGMQAMKAAKQAQQFNGNMGAVPMAPPPPVYQFNPNSGASQGGGVGAPLAPPTPDYGVPGDDTMYLGGPAEANIRGGLKAGGFIAPNVYKAGRSGVSGAAGGGGGGGGGRGGMGGSPNGKRSGPYNTSGGEYNLSGGGGTPSSGKSSGKKDDGSNPFADALAKLFPQDEKTGKPVVDMRGLASTNQSIPEDAYISGNPEETVEELSLFEQVTKKYRDLTYSGTI
ncbi:MAG: hypothetical protein M9962_03195 [Oligoflexia bacterium]|nr:hypothetical protein [Oligoflexia bacterium]